MLSLPLPNVVAYTPKCCRDPSRMLSPALPDVVAKAYSVSVGCRGERSDTRHSTPDTQNRHGGCTFKRNSTSCKRRAFGGTESVKNYIPISCQSYSLPKHRLRFTVRERDVQPSHGCTRTELAGSGAWERGNGMDPKYETAARGSLGAQRRCAGRSGAVQVFPGKRSLNRQKPLQGQKKGAR